MIQPFIEIGAPDADQVLSFFSAVMGWTVKDEGPQRWLDTPGGPVGAHGGDDPLAVVYLPVADLEAAIAAVRDNGGTVMGDINDEPGFGRFATCVDPQGVRFGLHQKT